MSALASPSISETYELLVSLLSKCPRTVEILPGDDSIWAEAYNPDSTEGKSSFAPFLFVDENLGIPQKILYKLYLHAVNVFSSARGGISTRLTTMTQQNCILDASLARMLDASSSILVLVNPSHQTALNVRKHLVRMRQIDPRAELRFMASLLSSQHCAKHGELWYHRRWLLSAAHDPPLTDIAALESCCRLQFGSQEALRQELVLVSRACELYPRNYFAWTHRLLCMQGLLSDYLAGIDNIGFLSTFRKEITGIKEWIDHHVSDYSAIHSLLVLSRIAFQSGDVFLNNVIVEEDLLDHAISLVQEYPTHEALWMYIRIVLSILDSWQTQKAQQFINNFVQPLACRQQFMTDGFLKVSQFATIFLDRRIKDHLL